MPIILKSLDEILIAISQKSREKRLSYNISQKTLSHKSGIPCGTIKKFEKTGKISLESLLKIALVLDSLDEFENLFPNFEDK